jgi:hypothetical protein
MSGLDLTTEPPPELLAQQALLKQQLAAAQRRGAARPWIQHLVACLAARRPAAPPQPDPKVIEQLQAIDEQLKAIELNKAVIELLRTSARAVSASRSRPTRRSSPTSRPRSSAASSS